MFDRARGHCPEYSDQEAAAVDYCGYILGYVHEMIVYGSRGIYHQNLIFFCQTHRYGLPRRKTLKFDVLYEDRHCLVVCKPPRLLTVSDESGDETLLSLVREYNASRQAPGKKGYVAPIHMLDRPVSGVIMFALSSKAAARLSDVFRKRELEKIYLAVVETVPAVSQAVLIDYLLKDRDSNTSRVVHAGTADAKRCELSYKVLATGHGRALLEVKPVTGRSHQIRVQLSNAGFPIYGDMRYGSKVEFSGAIALHACRLEFQHPVTKEKLKISVPPPESWRSLMDYGAFDV